MRNREQRMSQKNIQQYKSIRSHKEVRQGTSYGVQCLGLRAPNAGSPEFNPWSGNQIQQASTNTQCSQINKILKKKKASGESIKQYKSDVKMNKSLQHVIFIIFVQSLSRVQLFVTPQTVCSPPGSSIGFSRQEYRSGLPFPSPIFITQIDFNYTGRIAHTKCF